MTTVVPNYRERAPEALVLDTLREHAPITASDLAEAIDEPLRAVLNTLNHLHAAGLAQRVTVDRSEDENRPVAYWTATP